MEIESHQIKSYICTEHSGMITKEKIIQHVNIFPDKLSMEELIDRLIFVEKLEKRIGQSEKGETISEQELENEMKEWYK